MTGVLCTVYGAQVYLLLLAFQEVANLSSNSNIMRNIHLYWTLVDTMFDNIGKCYNSTNVLLLAFTYIETVLHTSFSSFDAIIGIQGTNHVIIPSTFQSRFPYTFYTEMTRLME